MRPTGSLSRVLEVLALLWIGGVLLLAALLAGVTGVQTLIRRTRRDRPDTMEA